VAMAVIDAMLTSDRVQVRKRCKPVGCELSSDGGKIISVTVRDLDSGNDETIEADFVIDATELGDLLPLAKVEYVSGAESHRAYGEPHAVDGDAQPDNVQAFTWCFAMGFDARPGASHVIEKPAQYDRWRNYVPKLDPPWPGRLLDWAHVDPATLNRTPGTLLAHTPGAFCYFDYRKIGSADRFGDPHRCDGVTLVNWPQNDYFEFNVIDKSEAEAKRALDDSRQLSLSLLYWMQTEGGFPGLYPAPDVLGTKDGFAKAPYFRESRRIKSVFTINEGHVGLFARYGINSARLELPNEKMRAEPFADSVGVGHYRIDLHPSTGGNNYIDIASLPFQIPLGALIPVRVENLLPACKNIGTTHISNGCYRLHPVEWNIGEAAGLVAAFCIDAKARPRAVREDRALLDDFQTLLKTQGIELSWPAQK